MALVIVPPKLLTSPSIPCRNKEMLKKWGYEKESTGWYKKEDKVLISEAQQWKLTKSLHDATHYGRDAILDLIQKTFSGQGLKRRVKQVMLT